MSVKFKRGQTEESERVGQCAHKVGPHGGATGDVKVSS